MTAYLRDLKGKPVAESEPIRMGFYRVIGVGRSLVFHDKLLFSQANTAPGVTDSSMSPYRLYIYIYIYIADAFY